VIQDDICCHDAKHSECVYLGVSKNGTPMKINKLVVDADRIIVISSVEPHYFAGYTGGRKSFLPGVSAYETIEANTSSRSASKRSPQASGEPSCGGHGGRNEGPQRQEDLLIMTVLDKTHRICSACAGDSRRPSKRPQGGDEVFVIDLKRKAEIVVAVTAFPYDIDLYQSQKALDNAKYAVKDGGVIILVTAAGRSWPAQLPEPSCQREHPKEALDKIAQGTSSGTTSREDG